MSRTSSVVFVLMTCLLLAGSPGRADAKDQDLTNAVSSISAEEMDRIPARDASEFLKLLPKTEVGVHVFAQDATGLTPSGGGSIFGFDEGVIGIGGSFTLRPNANSGFYVRGTGAYAVGTQKFEVGGTFSINDEVSLRATYGSAAAGIIMPITRRTAVYGQAGAFYSSTKGTFDDGTNEVDGESFNVFGIDTALGARVAVGGMNSLFLEQYTQFGSGSGEDGDAKYTASVKYGCFRLGMNFGF